VEFERETGILRFDADAVVLAENVQNRASPSHNYHSTILLHRSLKIARPHFGFLE
jgi:hypothetical protein